MPIGPALPPHLAHLAKNTAAAAPAASESDEEEEDGYAPALPPHLAAARVVAGPSRPPLSSSRQGGYSSPSPPRISRRDLSPPRRPQAEESDDDDDIGPRPDMAGPAPQRTAAEEFREREERRARLREEENKSKVLQREEWMLVPPSSGVLSNVDPLKKRASTFSRSTTATGEPVDQSVWTETPAARARRQADEVAGIKRRPDPSASAGAGSGKASGEERKRRRDDEIRNEVARHTKQNRGPSLLEKHQKKDTSADEPKAIWDHARDMGITGRLLGNDEREAKIKDAKGLNDRFGHGKTGAYQI